MSARDTVSAFRRRAADTERMVDESVQAVREERAERFEAARGAAVADASLEGTITRDMVTVGGFVRDRYGWHPVAKVNPATVTVQTGVGASGAPVMERVPYSRLREVRS